MSAVSNQSFGSSTWGAISNFVGNPSVQKLAKYATAAAVIGTGAYYGASYLNSLPKEICEKISRFEPEIIEKPCYFGFRTCKEIVIKEITKPVCRPTEWGNTLSSMKETANKIAGSETFGIIGALSAAAIGFGLCKSKIETSLAKRPYLTSAAIGACAGIAGMALQKALLPTLDFYFSSHAEVFGQRELPQLPESKWESAVIEVLNFLKPRPTVGAKLLLASGVGAASGVMRTAIDQYFGPQKTKLDKGLVDVASGSVAAAFFPIWQGFGLCGFAAKSLLERAICTLQFGACGAVVFSLPSILAATSSRLMNARLQQPSPKHQD